MQLTKHSKVARDPLGWTRAVSLTRVSQLIRGVRRTPDWLTMNRKLFGLWITALGVAQFALYVAGGDRPLELFYFDPRIGIYALAEGLGLGHEWPAPLQWVVAVWQLVIGAAVLLGLAGLKIYRIAELALAAPSLLFFAGVFLVNMSPSHGFSIRELPVPCAVFGVFSVMPLAGSMWTK